MMSDQCKSCSMRGDIKDCYSIECSKHDDWIVLKLKTENQALRARVAELKKAGRPLATMAFNLKQTSAVDASTRMSLGDCQVYWDLVVNKSHTQSLNDIKADAIEGVLDAAIELGFLENCRSTCDAIRKQLHQTEIKTTPQGKE